MTKFSSDDDEIQGISISFNMIFFRQCHNILLYIYSDDANMYKDEYLQQIAEIDEEEPPEIEDEEEETESDAIERMTNILIEQFKQQLESISQLQVLM